MFSIKMGPIDMPDKRWFLFHASTIIICLTGSTMTQFNTALQAEDSVATPAVSQGAIVTYKHTGSPSNSPTIKTDTRVSRLIGLHVPKGERPTALMPTGTFTATFTGHISLPIRSRLYFSLEGRGKVKLTIADKEIFDVENADLSKVEKSARIRLSKGANTFTFHYTPPADGDADVRLYWESSDFQREMIPPNQLTHAVDNKPLVAATSLRSGREMFVALRCTKCHEAGNLLTDANKRMPELDIDAPSLTNAGTRLGTGWMAQWIQSPKHFRHDATMPQLRGTPEYDDKTGHVIPTQQAWDIAAYLSTLGKKAATPKSPDKETLQKGGHLFASIGCIGCHTAPDHKDSKTIEGRRPLKWVSAKWQHGALASFLKQPNKHYKWIRMPTFGLTDDEASSLAAFVWSESQKSSSAITPSPNFKINAERGKALVQTVGCLDCHDIEENLKSTLNSPTLANLIKSDWAKGCLAQTKSKETNTNNKPTTPDFSFSPNQLANLRAFTQSALPTLAHRDAHEFATRQVAALNCNACHTRDGKISIWANHEPEVAKWIVPELSTQPKKPHDNPLDDDPFASEDDKGYGEDDPNTEGGENEAQVDQSRPNLTWVGEKLKPKLMATLIAGKLDYKTRPWLEARMPAFPARAQLLAQGLSLQHGRSPIVQPQPKPNGELATIGARLIGKEGGFSCVLCHGVGKQKALNVFEAQGINFMYVKERLRKDFYHRWMIKPNRIQANTRMPQFTSEDGTTPFTDLFEGDAKKQFEAMWQKLQYGRNILPGNQPIQK
jgi:mono/diheme cytochrome c family protein